MFDNKTYASLTNTVSKRPATTARKTIRLAVFASLAMAGCDTAAEDGQIGVATTSQALKVADEAGAKAAREESDRKASRQSYIVLKEQLATTAPEDSARHAMLRLQIDAVREQALAAPGEGKALVGSRGAERPVIAAARYETLRAKMATFDMSKPADVDAWANLKRKELGQ